MSAVPGVPRSELGDALRACRNAFAGVGVMSCMINLLYLTGSLFMLEVYDRVLPSRSVPTLIGLAIYVFAALCYIVALKKIPVSVAFPSVAASYAVVAIIAHLLWNEPFGWPQFAGLVLIVWGFAHYRATGWIDVWYPPKALKHITVALMLPAVILVVASYLRGRIYLTLKHPMLAGVKLWAAAHLLANGDLGSIILFGSFLGWAVFDRISLKPSTIAAMCCERWAASRNYTKSR